MPTIIVVLITIACLEVVSRIVLHFIYNRTFDFSVVEKNKYGTTSGIKANQSTSIWGKPFSTDSYGSRPQQATSSKRKKIYIGDSVLEGVGIADSLVFTSLLQAKNTERTILNLSMVGNTSSDYANMVDALLDTSKPSFIGDVESITVVYCLNDIYGKLSDNELPKMTSGFLATSNQIMQYCAIYKLLKLVVYNNSDKYFKYDEQFYKQEEKVHETIDNLVRAKNKCAAMQIAFQVVILPYRSQFTSKNMFPQQTLAYYLGMNGVQFVDLFPTLSKHANCADFFLFADEIHFSPTGHKAIAEAL